MMMVMKLVLLILLSSLATVVVSNQKKGLSEIYDKLLHDLENRTLYDSRIRPFVDEKPVQVSISIYVSSLHSISETTMDFKLELYFRERWVDPRLTYKAEKYNVSHVQLHESIAKHLWLPDTFLPNAIYTRNPKIESISHRFLLRLDPKGEVLFGRRISVTADCPMDLRYYPFDRQACALSIESYGHAIDDIIYKWRDGISVTMNEDLQLPDFSIMGVKTKVRNITLSTGIYSRLELCFFFSRNSGLYFVQIFCPATATVILSWILLYMGNHATLGDMIEVIIAMTFLYFSYTTMMPGVSYLKATDVFLGACFLFVFIAFTKMAHDKSVSIRRKKLQEKRQSMAAEGHHDKNPMKVESNEVSANMGLLQHEPISKCTGKPEQTSFKERIMNKRCRSTFIFPLLFILFCIFYFTTYLAIVQDNFQKKCQF